MGNATAVSDGLGWTRGFAVTSDLSWRVLSSLSACRICALVFGIAPALRASRIEAKHIGKNGKSNTQSLKNPLGKAFVVAQVALSLLLLVEYVFLCTLINLQSIPSGFNEENAMLFQVDTSATGFKAEDDPRLPPC